MICEAACLVAAMAQGLVADELFRDAAHYGDVNTEAVWWKGRKWRLGCTGAFGQTESRDGTSRE